MEELKLNLWQKMSEVMKEVAYLSKDDHIKFASTNYKAISEEKVTRTVRESLIANGLVIYPYEQEHFKEGSLTTVNVKYKIVNLDNPSEWETLVSSGTGADTQDKGVGKAMTYAYKYMLLRTFAIPTGEDPDKISSAQLDEEMSKANSENAPLKKTDATTSILSEAQIKRLYAIAYKAGFSRDIVKGHMVAKYKIDSMDKLNKSQYDEMCIGYEKSIK